METAISSRDEVSKKIEVATDSISSLEIKILDVESNSEVASELGPLKYISELTDTPMNKVVNILMLVIIFVFDPLAISLVIAANFAFERLRKKDEDEEIIEDKKVKDEVSEEFNSLLDLQEQNDVQSQLREIEERDKYKPTQEDLERLEKELEKLQSLREAEVEKSENEIKLEENKAEVPSNEPQIKTLRYQPRDAVRNTKINRI